MGFSRSTINKNTIVIKSYVKDIVEYKADAALSPGHLIKLNNDEEVLKHAAGDGELGPRWVAVEDETQGREVSDAYKAGERVRVWIPGPGDEGLLIVGGDAEIELEKGSAIHSAEDGTATLATAGNAGTGYQVIGYSLEDVTIPDDGSSLVRIRFA